MDNPPPVLSRDTPRIPSALQRAMGWVILAILSPWITALIVTHDGPYFEAAVASGAIVLIAVAAFCFFAVSRSVAIVRAHRGLVCYYCSYPLDAIEGERCPECAQRFDREHLRIRWCQQFPTLKNEDWCPKDVPPLDWGSHG